MDRLHFRIGLRGEKCEDLVLSRRWLFLRPTCPGPRPPDAGKKEERTAFSTLSGRVTVDDGGLTKYGISSTANPGIDVAGLNLDDAKGILKSNYWDAIGGDSLPAGLQQTALDAAVNQGVDNARRWIQLSGGDPAKFNALRRQQYEHLAAANPAKYGKYLKGWLARVPSDTQTALATASRGGAGAGTGASPISPVPAAALLAHRSGGTTIYYITNESQVGTVNVNTRATDAKGIADSIKPLLRQAALSAQSQSGAS